MGFLGSLGKALVPLGKKALVGPALRKEAVVGPALRREAVVGPALGRDLPGFGGGIGGGRGDVQRQRAMEQIAQMGSLRKFSGRRALRGKR